VSRLCSRSRCPPPSASVRPRATATGRSSVRHDGRAARTPSGGSRFRQREETCRPYAAYQDTGRVEQPVLRGRTAPRFSRSRSSHVHPLSAGSSAVRTLHRMARDSTGEHELLTFTQRWATAFQHMSDYRPGGALLQQLSNCFMKTAESTAFSSAGRTPADRCSSAPEPTSQLDRQAGLEAVELSLVKKRTVQGALRERRDRLAAFRANWAAARGSSYSRRPRKPPGIRCRRRGGGGRPPESSR